MGVFSPLTIATVVSTHAAGGYAPGQWHMHGWDHMMDSPYYGGFLMWIILLILAAVIVYLIVQGTKGRTPSGPVSGSSSETPLEILKKRYARGEITKDEFDRMKDDLQK
jgi:putative membrane protein